MAKDIPWGKFDLESKPDDSLLNIEPDQEGYYSDAAGERFSFNGNRTLRPAHVRMHLNEYHIQEIAKCSMDFRYFMFNYCKVLTPSGWRVPDLRDYQEEYLQHILTNNRTVYLAGRQLGKTVSTALYFVWAITFHNDVKIGIGANVEKGSIEVLDKVKKIYGSLPIWLQQGVEKWNVKTIILENKSSIITSATNGDAFRGFSFVGGEGYSTLYVDECVEYNTIVRIVSLDTKITEDIKIGDLYNKYTDFSRLKVLTPSGYRSFDSIKKTIRSDGLVLTSVSGSLTCTPEHLIKTENGFVQAKDSLGKFIDTKCGLELVKSLSVHDVKSSYFDLINVDSGHVYFTNNTISHNCAFVHDWQAFADSVLPTVSSDPNANIILTSTANGMNHFYDIVKLARAKASEYSILEAPWNCLSSRNEEWKQKIISTNGIQYFNQNYGNEFIGSSYTLVNANALNKLISRAPLESNDNITIYQKPVKGIKYIVLGDLASGAGDDFSVLQVIKLNKRKFEQVAIFRSKDTPVLSMPLIIQEIAKKYNDAFVFMEINYGEEAANRLYHDLEYENLLTIAVHNGKQKLQGFRGKMQTGLRVDMKVKQTQISSLKTLIESNKLIIVDNNTITELYSFVQHGVSFAAEPGKHDDCIMSLALLGWLVTQPVFAEIIDYDYISDYENEKSEELSDLIPAAFFGYNDPDEWSEFD